jgi:hypothetical protein
MAGDSNLLQSSQAVLAHLILISKGDDILHLEGEIGKLV